MNSIHNTTTVLSDIKSDDEQKQSVRQTAERTNGSND